MSQLEQHSYREIKLMALLAFYDFCRDMSMTGDTPLSQILGYTACDFEDFFKRPIEELMFETAILILSGNWNKHNGHSIRRFVKKQYGRLLEKVHLEALLDAESRELIYDLDALSLLQATFTQNSQNSMTNHSSITSTPNRASIATPGHTELKPNATYFSIKSDVLLCLYECCRDGAIGQGIPYPSVLDQVAARFENRYRRPIEILLFSCVQLVLAGGFHAEASIRNRSQIERMLATWKLDDLTQDLPADESAEFRHDLKILKFADAQ